MKRVAELGVAVFFGAVCVLLALSIPAEAEAGTFSSDDFNSFNLDTGLWTFVDPVGDATLKMVGTNTQDAWVSISVPAGTAHDVWTAGNEAPRVMQPAADEDFEIEVKFESGVSEAYQMQGILVEQDSDNFLRFDFYSDDVSTKLYAASFAGGVPTAHVSSVITDTGVSPLYLRVKREGNEWLQSFSFDGQSWTVGGSFYHALAVSSVGAFVGNAGNGGAPPAHTGTIDYFFNTASPIELEDGASVVDSLPPLIYNVQSVAGQTRLRVNWSTDELATGTVRYGETPGYELGSVNHSDFQWMHNSLISGLQPATTYNFGITSTDESSNEAVSGNFTVTTDAPGSPVDPVVDVWYGSEQAFGILGTPQRWVNVLGNVSDPDGIASLTYSLNGGAQVPLSIGPDDYRLAHTGDFNIEIDRADMATGTNVVLITAEDNLGNTTVEQVDVEYATGNTWPTAYSIDWSSAGNIPDVAQVVDGLWAIEGDTIRPVGADETTYDRLIAVGDMEWIDYEVTVPITIHQFYDTDPGVGILVRWNGHGEDEYQPHRHPPFGGLGWFRFPYAPLGRVSIMGNGLADIARDYSGRQLETGVPYIFKMRVETEPSGESVYSLKIWEADDPEPSVWDLTGYGNDIDPDEAHGSMMLVAHRTDASFGDVTIIPVNPDWKTLTVNTIGGGSVTAQPDQPAYAPGEVVTLTADASPGSAFDSWSGDLVSTDNPDTISMDDDKVVTATFVLEEYVLTIDTVGDGGVDRDPNQATYHYGDVVTLTATADLGWTFDGWSGGLSGADNPATITITGDTVVTASFAAEVYTLTAGTLGSGRVDKEPEQTTYQYGDTVTLTATADPGWTFTGWSGHLTGTANPQAITITGDTVVTATFAQEEYDLTVGTVGDGGVDKDPDRVTYHHGDVVTLTATADPGWAFSGWIGGLSGSDNPATITIIGDTVVTASFTAEVYTLTAGTLGSGRVDKEPEQTTYQYGDIVTLTATADLGWAFDGWSGGLSGADNPATITIIGDTVVTASFVAEAYTLTAGTLGSGGVDKEPDQPTYQYGDTVTLTATADLGWVFTGWNGHLTGTVNPQAITITKDTVVTATFTQEEYYLTVGTVGNGRVDKDPDRATYHYGDVITLTAVGDPGWTFIGWSGDLGSTDNPMTTSITGNAVVTATFANHHIFLPWVAVQAPAGSLEETQIHFQRR